MNCLHLLGRLVKDPVLQFTQNRVPYCKFRIAVKRKYGVDENVKPITDYFEVISWRNQAEFISKFFTKGKAIIVHGEIHNANYTDKMNVQHFAMEVLAEQLEFADTANPQPSAEPLPPSYVKNQPQQYHYLVKRLHGGIFPNCIER